MRVTVSEADVGDVAAVALVLVAWCLKRKEAGPLWVSAEEGPSYPSPPPPNLSFQTRINTFLQGSYC